MNKEFTLKKYDAVDELILASFTCGGEDITMEDLKSSKIGGMNGDQQEISIDYDQMEEGIINQGYWGWIEKSNKTIHYWCGKPPSFEELVHFFAHEIGHETGTPDADEFQEEMRAEGYGEAAKLACVFAREVLNAPQPKQKITWTLKSFWNGYTSALDWSYILIIASAFNLVGIIDWSFHTESFFHLLYVLSMVNLVIFVMTIGAYLKTLVR